MGGLNRRSTDAMARYTVQGMWKYDGGGRFGDGRYRHVLSVIPGHDVPEESSTHVGGKFTLHVEAETAFAASMQVQMSREEDYGPRADSVREDNPAVRTAE